YPLETPVQPPDAELLMSRVTHDMHEDGRAYIARIERGRVRQYLQAIVHESANPRAQAGDLLRTQGALVGCTGFLPPTCGLGQRRQPQSTQPEVFSRCQVGE